jgi:hypothetical protein
VHQKKQFAIANHRVDTKHRAAQSNKLVRIASPSISIAFLVLSLLSSVDFSSISAVILSVDFVHTSNVPELSALSLRATYEVVSVEESLPSAAIVAASKWLLLWSARPSSVNDEKAIGSE